VAVETYLRIRAQFGHQRRHPVSHLVEDPSDRRLGVTSAKLASGDVFGIEKYLAEGARIGERSLAAADGNGTGLRVVTTDDDDIEGRLVDEVLERRNTLWCVGSHGRTAVGELMFGSVSADLVRDAEVPIVVIGPHSELRPTATVLAVALDGTDLSETILPAAVQVAHTLGLTLRLREDAR
jgi:nucleotide-binding universal stress UspA family protein